MQVLLVPHAMVILVLVGALIATIEALTLRIVNHKSRLVNS